MIFNILKIQFKLSDIMWMYMYCPVHAAVMSKFERAGRPVGAAEITTGLKLT
jgi:hypothetical protein